MTKAEIADALASWVRLQEYITKSGEKDCLALFEAERTGKRRLQFLLRIHSRYNRVRAHRERDSIKRTGRFQ